MEPDQSPETAVCVVCPVLRKDHDPREPKEPPVCRPCRDRVLEHLAAIPAAYQQLDPQPVRGTTDILSRVFESKPPLNVGDLSLLAGGWDTPVELLEQWVTDWSRRRGEPPPTRPTVRPDATPGRDPVRDAADWWVSVLVGRLIGQLDWAFDNHEYIADFAMDVRRMAGEVRAHADEMDRRGHGLGPCPKVFRGDYCQRRLFLPPGATVTSCTRCGTTWSIAGGGYLKLWSAQADAGLRDLLRADTTLDTVAAARWLMDNYGGDFSNRQTQVRKWANRGHMPKPTDPDGAGYDAGGRGLYRLTDLKNCAERMLGPMPVAVLE